MVTQPANMLVKHIWSGDCTSSYVGIGVLASSCTQQGWITWQRSGCSGHGGGWGLFIHNN